MNKPAEKVFYDVTQESYNHNSAPELDGMKLVRDTPTIDAYVNETQKYLLVGLRGTNANEFKDLQADLRITLSRLSTSPRYKYDKNFIQELLNAYPGYKIYLAGHSLGGAMATQLKRDFPQIGAAVEYNPAVQPKDLMGSAGDITRIYTNKDPLYLMGGRLVASRVIQASSSNPLTAHGLDQFSGLYGRTDKSAVEMEAEKYIPAAGHLDFTSPVAAILQAKGDVKIVRLNIRRNPVAKALESVLNFITIGRWNEVKQKYGYDRFVHLGLHIHLSDGSEYVLEKLQVVSLRESSQVEKAEGLMFLQVPLKTNETYTMRSLIDKTRQRMGNYRFFTYDTFENNCQAFVSDALEANGLMNSKRKEFIVQPVDEFVKELPFYTRWVANAATNIGSVVTGAVQGYESGPPPADLSSVGSTLSSLINAPSLPSLVQQLV